MGQTHTSSPNEDDSPVMNKEDQLHTLLGTFRRQYHIHVYNGETVEDQENANLMVSLLKEAESKNLFKEEVTIETGFVYPSGPHKFPQWEIRANQSDIGIMIDFIMRRRKNNVVMIHPVSMEEHKSHTLDAFWWGIPKELDEEYLWKLEGKE